MPQYRYRAVDSDGAPTVGTMEEASARRVTAILEEKGLSVSSVEEVPGVARAVTPKVKLSWEDIEFLNSQLLALAKSGLPLAPALDAIGKELRRGSLEKVVSEMRSGLVRGMPLHEALQRHAGAVPHVYIAAVRAGEETGNLAAVLEQFAGYATQMVTLKSRAREALAYPLLVLCVTIGVVALLLGRILPEFATVFKDFDAQLPAMTRFWIAVSDFLRMHYGVVIVVACAFLLVSAVVSRSKPGGYAVDWLKLHVWGVRGPFNAASMARFCRSMGVLLAGRAPVDNSIELSAAMCGNRVLEAAALDAAKSVRQGTRLALAFEMTGYYSGLFCWLVEVSETRGDVPAAMFDLAKNYEDRFMRSSRIMISVLAPLLLFIMAVIVMSVVVALYQPIFSLSDAISGR
ncbi:MAG: type II secretion system F family protein [Candidatus Hydrogenedentes bacterium]|nr:type II secretion system F family protein [Candidatus Hydrogenedentota bacterium]